MKTVSLCAGAIAMTEKVPSFHAGSEGRIAIDAAGWELVLRNSAEGSKQLVFWRFGVLKKAVCRVPISG